MQLQDFIAWISGILYSDRSIVRRYNMIEKKYFAQILHAFKKLCIHSQTINILSQKYCVPPRTLCYHAKYLRSLPKVPCSLVSASEVWCIWHTKVETLQECRSRRRIGWIMLDFRETCVSRSLTFRQETRCRDAKPPHERRKLQCLQLWRRVLN